MSIPGGKRPKQEHSLSEIDERSGSESDDQARVLVRKKVRWERPSTEGNGDIDDAEVDNSTSDKVCLAVWCQNGRVGCAYYDPTKSVIFVLEDSQETNHFDLTKMLLDQVQPDFVLISSKSDETFMDIIRDHVEALGGLLQIRPHKDFVAAKGRDRLLSLPLLSDLKISQDDDSLNEDDSSSEPRNAYDFMKKRRGITGDPTAKRWSASIRLSNFALVESSPLSIASVGALLDHMVRERTVTELGDEGLSGLDIRNIEVVALDHVMQINADALFSLQIFENESHASVHSDRTKEGLSLFGTLNRTKTTLGRSLLRTWLLRPALSIPTIMARHDAVKCFLRPENLTTSNAMHGHLNGIKNVPRLLHTMKTGRAGISEWQGLVKFTFHTVMLRDALTGLHEASGVEIVKKLISALDIARFREVGVETNRIIDWEESTNAGRVCVRPRIDENLDNLKHVYRGIDSVLSKVAEKICQTVSADYASSLNVVYFPQLGFLICVPMQEEWKTEQGIHVKYGWTFQFSSDAQVYFRSQEMDDMNTHIGDLYPAIVDREIEIIQELLDKILTHSDAIASACDVCAELDCLLSFAEASRANDYRRPEMVEENVIDIIAGRHPLQEQVVDTFVPNDTQIAGGHGSGPQPVGQDGDLRSVLLCTGANACGKSVYLKQARPRIDTYSETSLIPFEQVALIQIMAQIGCFVPAESARLGVIDKVFTRISTRESVSKVQSAFMIDLNQVSVALRNATPRSLILLDEFGKGTVSTDGAGLFCGVLTHLLDRGPNCPKVLAASHFHDVFHEKLLNPDTVHITFVHMQIMFTSSTRTIFGGIASNLRSASTEEEEKDGGGPHPSEKVTYLYQLAPGLALESHAAACAEIFGIPRRIVDRAQYVSDLLSMHELGQLLDEDMTEEERADLEDAEAVCRRYLAWSKQNPKEDDTRLEDGLSVKAHLAQVLGRNMDEYR